MEKEQHDREIREQKEDKDVQMMMMTRGGDRYKDLNEERKRRAFEVHLVL